ncbi:MAG: hypothetical protein WBL50_04355 [Candidatus Acidiferrum sp.]
MTAPPSQFTLTVTDIGTGNGTVTDNLQQIDCTTTAGVQSGTCSASYSAGTPVTRLLRPAATLRLRHGAEPAQARRPARSR